jgi:hypothetical protein
MVPLLSKTIGNGKRWALGMPFQVRLAVLAVMFALFSVLLIFVVRAWVGPSATPPSGNPANVPIGAIVPFGGGTIPQGWLLANGQAVSRSQYPALFAVLCPGGSCSFGNGDGSTTFNLPNLQDRFALGASSVAGRQLGNSGGSWTASHSHTFSPSPHYHTHSHTITWSSFSDHPSHHHTISPCENSAPRESGGANAANATHDHSAYTVYATPPQHPLPGATDANTDGEASPGGTIGGSGTLDVTNGYLAVHYIIRAQ